MNNPFEQFGFTLELTKDQSPTLRPKPTEIEDAGETMHHSGGAAAETTYIYQSVIRSALKSAQLNDPHPTLQTVVVGLGLGYIEISWAAVIKQMGLSANEKISIDSFETVKNLRKLFLAWINQKEDCDTHIIYNQISQYFTSSENQSCEIRNELKKNFDTHGKLFDNVLNHQLINKNYNLICFDAYSQITSQPLWEDCFLLEFIRQRANQDCVITSYGCTGVLKKILVNEGFELLNRPGFSGKRASTLALRGNFKNHQSLFESTFKTIN
ncbi:MAG: hypothetical protein H7061_01260 [Bdellovibrionaceae bacterium]|nr:hypothetical protein [Bdellovibrio sp.]